MGKDKKKEQIKKDKETVKKILSEETIVESTVETAQINDIGITGKKLGILEENETVVPASKVPSKEFIESMKVNNNAASIKAASINWPPKRLMAKYMHNSYINEIEVVFDEGDVPPVIPQYKLKGIRNLTDKEKQRPANIMV